jgi:hypothetical protein
MKDKDKQFSRKELIWLLKPKFGIWTLEYEINTGKIVDELSKYKCK